MIDDHSIQHFETMKLSDLSTRDQGIVTTMMKAFDLKDFKVALAEFYWLINDTPGHDDKGFLVLRQLCKLLDTTQLGRLCCALCRTTHRSGAG